MFNNECLKISKLMSYISSFSAAVRGTNGKEFKNILSFLITHHSLYMALNDSISASKYIVKQMKDGFSSRRSPRCVSRSADDRSTNPLVECQIVQNTKSLASGTEF